MTINHETYTYLVYQLTFIQNSYIHIFEKLHINLKPLYTLLHDDVKFQWTSELEKKIQDVKNAMTADTELTIPNTKHSFVNTKQ